MGKRFGWFMWLWSYSIRVDCIADLGGDWKTGFRVGKEPSTPVERTRPLSARFLYQADGGCGFSGLQVLALRPEVPIIGAV